MTLHAAVRHCIIKGVRNQILTIKQASKLLQVDPNTIYRWARAGKFPASKIGKEWRILYSDVFEFVEKHKRKHELFTNEQTAELITALAGRRELPLKFQYLGEGADKFVSFEHTSEYGIGQTEIDLILNNEDKILSHLPNREYSVLDVGCGDGKKAAAILTRLRRYSQNKLNYFPIDISERMIDIAIGNVELAHNGVCVEQFKEDFEKANISKITYYLRRRYQRDNIILFLGQTIGNIADSHRVLINLRESMTEKEALLVGMALLPKKNPLEGYDQEIIYDWLLTVPGKIGITKENVDIKLSFNSAKHQIEYKLEFKKNWSKNYGSDFLSFHKGQKILVAVSHKFTRNEIFSLFAGAGFKIELFLESKEKKYGVVLCKPYSWERQ
jgi:excisionase family DNA binding protein